MDRLESRSTDPDEPRIDHTVAPLSIAGVPIRAIWTLVGFFAVTLLAFVSRLLTLDSYVGHVDEPASLLAISRTAELGYPLFPSGVLYLQGSVFSYLAVPLTWFLDGTSLLHASRVLYLLLAIAVAPLTMALALVLTEWFPVALFAGTMVALDPTLMVWGISIRPYGLLTVEVVLLALLLTLAIRDGRGARWAGIPTAVLFPVVFGIGTFTHIGIWLMLPPAGVACLLIWRGSLWRENRSILLSGMACLPPLIAFMTLGELVGTGSGTATNQAGKAFVGSHLFSWRKFLEMPGPRFELWTDNFRPGGLHWAMPAAIGIVSVGLVVWLRRQRGRDNWRSSAVIAMLVLHWMTVAEVAFMVDMDPDPRYLAHVLPLGYVILATGLGLLARHVVQSNWSEFPAVRPRLMHVGVAVSGVAIVTLTVAYLVAGAQWRVGYAGGNPDFWGATEWAAEHGDADALLLTALPPAAWFWFDPADAVFLAGPEGSNRVLRYTKQNREGETGDYWLGVPSVQSIGQLCSVLADPSRPVLVVVDRARLNAKWGFRGEMHDIVVGSASIEYTGVNGTLVMRALPVAEWSPEAVALCGG